jgi:hypothetical protein
VIELIIKAFAGSFFEILGKTIRDIFGDMQTAQQNHDLGASRAEAQGRAVIQEIADDQSARPSQGLNPDDDDALSRVLRP